MNPFCSAYRPWTAMPRMIAPRTFESAGSVLGYNRAHGLSADGATGADPQGSGDPRAILLARLLAGEGPEGGVPGGLDPGLRAGRLARDDHSGGLRRLGPGCDRSDGDAARELRRRRRDDGRFANPLLSLSSDAPDQTRPGGPYAGGPAPPPPRPG